MAENSLLGINKVFPIKNADGTPFHDLVIQKATVESVVMSLGDKISGDIYYRDNSLTFTMQEYVEFEGVKYVLVNPPTVVREGLVKDNSQLKGMTKYSLVFYHPMYMLGNFPFTDIAVTQDEENYLSQNKTFSWIGNLFDFIDKLNVNLEATEWVVGTNIVQPSNSGSASSSSESGSSSSSSTSSSSSSTDWNEEEYLKAIKTSEVLTFDKNFISDALKTAYDTWEIPFVISSINMDVNGVLKKYLISFGLPTQEIYQRGSSTPFVFQFGQNVGLKNNSRTPKNNKIVTRIVPQGAERNIPFGYPQIRWYGDSDKEFTYGNHAGVYYGIVIDGVTIPKLVSYPIYKGILGGQYVQLIKHPFTRKNLMPSVYSQCVFNKVSFYNADGTINESYDPDLEIKDYIDADNSFPNPINPVAPSVEIHEFEEVYPRLGEARIVRAYPIDTQSTSGQVLAIQTISELIGDDETEGTLLYAKANSSIENEKDAIQALIVFLDEVANQGGTIPYYANNDGGAYTYTCAVQPMTASKPHHWLVNYTSGTFNLLDVIVVEDEYSSQIQWDDTMDDNGEYVQSYFKIKLPKLSFDLYACASITENMQINMRSGACMGCTFDIQVDWEDYKKNFYNADGEFDPVPHTQDGDGHVRNATKYPDSSARQIEVIVQKDLNTFGTLMPNVYQNPSINDTFVILGISLPTSYITLAERELDETASEYMLENNIHYYEYPLKFDEYFLTKNQYILSQIRNNNVVRFRYHGSDMALYIKQITIKYGETPLPQYDITLTDDVDIVLNKIGQVTDDVSRMRVQLSELQKYYTEDIAQQIGEKLSKVSDDIAQGRITFQQGLESLGSVVLDKEIRSTVYEQGLYTGKGWRIDERGNAELESLRVRSFLEIVELLINRMQAQEGDTVFSDNDQIEKVKEVETDGETSYILSFKEKYDGYITSQQDGNILKGIINTLAANYAGVSTYVEPTSSSSDEGQSKDGGNNYYYTSWMQVVETHKSTGSSLGVNQVRVVLYGDSDTPAGKNFIPCQLMNVARWGNVLNPNEQGISSAEKARRRALQSFFAISTTDGRITKYIGVNSPILRDTNFGTTLGTLPDFIQNWSIKDRLIEGRDYLFAQGVIVGDFIKVDVQGDPIPNIVDCGTWVDGSQIPNPTKGHGIYLVNGYNEETLQWETHDVWHLGARWRCRIPQPVDNGGNLTYYEPKWGSYYWEHIEGDTNYTIEFVSTQGYSFRQGFVNTTIQPHLLKGGIDITPTSASSDEIAPYYNWVWERCLQSDWNDGNPNFTPQDEYWNGTHTGYVMQGINLNLTNEDMPAAWSLADKTIFNCKVTINDGSNTIIVENQVIS